ncbi:MAG: M23 family metallopeptidase [Rothia sp. (in: high G+C Gram-positive bacteria)]|uniref:M23 family metallopeptidase n=1 Tax=Rothia sp. (in: high G+C Gram-positive bacteria) TaxID=1885016 RepID=UPI0026DF6125|nr:M23 family metallopeptidase [Rothia sp. (in: high G+C Gram-positive bacteria)]MDO5750371.1 M23 family metallopeptidase [Rothia sp. (in: high G+C Gram-positive bacteria)]
MIAALLRILFVPVVAFPLGLSPGALPISSATEASSLALSHRATPARGVFLSPTGRNHIRVVRAFKKPEKRWSAGHRGVKLRMPAFDTPVYAPAAGRISFSGYVVNRRVIVIEHEDGSKSSFEPVADALATGSEVQAGERIAALDSSIRPCGSIPCLHWGVRIIPEGTDTDTAKASEYIDPLTLLNVPRAIEPSRLYPTGSDFAA